MSRPGYDYRHSGENRLWGALGYLIFFIPLLVRPTSRFYRFCANQGLILCLAVLFTNILFGLLGWLLGWVPLVGWIISVAGRLVDLLLVVAMVCYGFKAYMGSPERLPLIGGFDLIR